MKNSELQEKIGYRFNNDSLLETALTHSSYTREQGLGREHCNERLEFLGDAFFDAIIGEALFKRLKSSEEGRLTKLRAAVVCERSLADAGRALGIGSLIRLGNGERKSGGADRQSIVADAMEAVIGAVFLDGGYEAARGMVTRLFEGTLSKALAGGLMSDYKTGFQEIMQKNGTVEIEYRLDHECGPDHKRVFYTSVYVNGRLYGRGVGRSKKESEQSAAENAIAVLSEGNGSNVL